MYTVDIISSTNNVKNDVILAAKAYDVVGAIKIDDVIKREGKCVLRVTDWALLSIHNDESDNPDYKKLVLFDDTGERYSTGSVGATDSFINLWNMCAGRATEVEFRFFKRPSKRRDGEYMACTIN